MSKWDFERVPRGGKIRESLVSEFFKSNSISNAGEALIREGIQNSLDASSGGGDPVRIRIVHATEPPLAPSYRDVAPFFSGLEEHLAACDIETPDEQKPVSFIAFEDFNTTGLFGDPKRWRRPESHNPFFAFFRAEGWSQKDEGAGRWGVGKFAFPSASRIKTFFGFTVPEDAAPTGRLMGQSILKHHEIGEDVYKPDGSFGKWDEALALPLETSNEPEGPLIRRFAEQFDLQRGNQPGLSVVVPFLNEDAGTYEGLVGGVIKDYYLPILEGQLVVQIKRGDTGSVQIDRDFLTESGPHLGNRHDEVDIDGDLVDDIGLASWYVGRQTSDPRVDIRVELAPNAGDGGPTWSDATVEVGENVELPDQSWRGDEEELSDGREAARQLLESRRRLLIEVSTDVFVKKGNRHPATFYVALERDDDGRSSSSFFRNVLRISDVNRRNAAGFRSLVRVPENALGQLLGDAENPSHTRWSSRANTFVGKYKYGLNLIKIVRNAPQKLVATIRGDDDSELDRIVLSDVFTKPPTQDAGLGPEPDDTERRTEEEEPEEPEDPSERNYKKYELQVNLDGGFVVSPNPIEEADPPDELRIRVAYDVASGDPLKNHSKFDFDFTADSATSPIQIECSNCKLKNRQTNELRFDDFEEPFEIKVTGFDTNRDLYVDPRTITKS